MFLYIFVISNNDKEFDYVLIKGLNFRYPVAITGNSKI